MLRYPLLSLMTLAVVASMALADPPKAPQLSPQEKAKALESCLPRWEKAMQDMKAFEAQVDRVEQDRVNRTQETFTGVVKYMQPNLVLMDLKKQDKPEIYEKWLCTGTYLYQWVPQAKKINAIEIPKAKGSGEDSVMSVLGCIKADEARKRYDLDYAKEDQYYHYIEIKPKSPEDKGEFSWARLVLNKETFLPREIRFITPGNDEVLWNIRSLQVYATTDRMDRKDFARPEVPKDWKLEQSPRVVRPHE